MTQYILLVIFCLSVLRKDFVIANDGCENVIDISGDQSFNELDTSHVLNNTCIRILNDQKLSRVISLKHIEHVKMLSNATVTISCSVNVESGITFESSADVSLIGLRFVNCGHSRKSTSRSPFKTATTPNITSALFFYQTNDVSLMQVTFEKSNGYSIVTYDIFGDFQLNSVHFQNNILSRFIYNNTHYDGFSSGGALYVEYRKDLLLERLIRVPGSIQIEDCSFVNLTGEVVSATPNAEGMDEGHIGFGRGAAIGIIFMGSTASNMNISIINSRFHGNKAAWGGAVYFRYRDEIAANAVHMRNNTFSNNIANLSGGAIFSTTTQRGRHNNTLAVIKCTFTCNRASVGGAIAQMHHHDDEFTEYPSTFIESTSFQHNKASLGSAIILQRVFVIFTNVSIKNNSAIDRYPSISGQGAVYVFKSTLKFQGETNDFYHNVDSALVVDCTETYITGALSFVNNKGENGGAISMFGYSHLHLYNSTRLLFKNNSAVRHGGAIFVDLPGTIVMPVNPLQDLGLKVNKCFMTFEDDSSKLYEMVHWFAGSVDFENNNAKINGHSVYTTSLHSCQVKGMTLNTTLIGWKDFSFVPEHKSQISTRSKTITVNQNEWSHSPGREFTPSVKLEDEMGNHVSEPINVEIENEIGGDVQLVAGRRFIVTNNSTITLALLGNNKNNKCFNISVSSAINNHTSTRIENLNLTSCYFGYTLLDKTCKCDILKNQAKGIAYCYDNNIYLYKNRWAYSNQLAIKDDSEVTAYCPPGYCKDCTDKDIPGVCLYIPKDPKLCIKSRNKSSLLCSECNTNLSVLFGTEKCGDCKGKSYHLIWKFALFLLIIGVCIAIVIAINVDIYATYLNGFLYYYQVVNLLVPSSFTMREPVKFISGIVNIRSSGGHLEICLYDGLNNMQKNFINYIIPTTMLLWLYIVSLISKRPGGFLARKNCMKAFTIISLFAYQDITRISFVLLQYAHIDNNQQKYVWVYAKYEYFGKHHLPYAVIAILVVLVIVIGFPLCLVYSSRLVALDFRCCQNPFTRMMAVFENFQKSFKPKFIYFSGYYFISRAVLLSVETFVPKSPNQNIIQCIICALVCVLFTFAKPYKNKWMNAFDVTVLFNLFVVSVVGSMMRKTLKIQATCTHIINVLLLIPLIMVALRLIYLYTPLFSAIVCKHFKNFKNRRYSKKRASYPQRLLISDEEEEEEEEDVDNDRRYRESQN